MEQAGVPLCAVLLQLSVLLFHRHLETDSKTHRRTPACSTQDLAKPDVAGPRKLPAPRISPRLRTNLCERLSVVAYPPPVRCDLVPVPAQRHAAPTPMMRSCVVRKPEHARLILATLHETKISVRQQIGRSLGYRPENRLVRVASPHRFHFQRARFVPHQPRMTLCAEKKSVQQRRISAPAALPLLHERANVLAQGASGIQQGIVRPASAGRCRRKSCLIEPIQDVLVALKDIHQYALQPHLSI